MIIDPWAQRWAVTHPAVRSVLPLADGTHSIEQIAAEASRAPTTARFSDPRTRALPDGPISSMHDLSDHVG